MDIDASSQQKLIELYDTSALVLAPPGCGKTHILARRIFHANAMHSIEFDKMLCITFTNRAAREMKSRITAYFGYSPQGLFVGNIHRFCLRFLYVNGLIAPDTSVLDEEDLLDYLLTSFGISKSDDVKNFLESAAYIYQCDNDHPSWVMRRPSVLPSDRMRKLVAEFVKFKAENKLIDFDEILLKTYTALLYTGSEPYRMTGYTWVQVDETQDMTPLQLAIIELVSDSVDHTALFLGDEQQAIFSFLGAGGRALDIVKRMCKGKILHLYRNYRSPSYLVSLCNELAGRWLGIDSTLLPSAIAEDNAEAPLTAYHASENTLRVMAAAQARYWLETNPDESITILVRTNREGDDMSHTLSALGLPHFHISKQDVFHQTSFKTIWSHLAVVANPLQWHAWSRLLYQTDTIRTLREARRLVAELRARAISVDDLFLPPSQWRLSRFCNSMNNGGIVVVFDTETTGLDIFNDDIVQISAIKMKDGEIIAGTKFEVFITTDKTLPPTLKDSLPNQLVEIYADARKYSPAEAMAMFTAYIGDASALAGHNIAFDCGILRNYISRVLSREPADIFSDETRQIDTLAISRLLYPHLRTHTLAALIDYFKIDGHNSHNASDDVAATAELIKALIPEAATRFTDSTVDEPYIHRPSQQILRIAARLKKKYGDFYSSTRLRTTLPGFSLSEAVNEAHQYLTSTDCIEPIQHLDYILQLIDNFIVDTCSEPGFATQLTAHLYDLLTFHESDLFACGLVKERLSVMTVHKAKGLESDNVIVANASSRFGRADESIRLLYVAFSRARRRLAVGIGRPHDNVMNSLIHHFRVLTPQEIRVAVKSEIVNIIIDNPDAFDNIADR